jgi:TnsA endonuclease N terminal
MANFAQGVFTPKNAHKYVGKHQPKYRSGWELTFMTFCDSNDHIIYWASESLRIPYRHPLTGKPTNYIPDFFVMYENKFGKKIAEVVEIKPKKQSLIESKTASARDRVIVAINHAKWAAAMAYCKQQGYSFRVITEDDLFYNGRKGK